MAEASATTATVINDTEHVQVDVAPGDRWLMEPNDFTALTGWTLKPEGLCRDDVCAPIYRKDEVLGEGGLIDLAGAAPVIGMTAVVDAARGVAALAASADARAADMTSLRAPDFTLPDLHGNPVSLHDFDRRKVLLLAWSSW
jgi:hypothetical protein